MKGKLSGLEPESVFRYFEELSRIPRCSHNEKAVSNYLVSFAKELGLEVFQDSALNVVIKKPATRGHEKAPGIILQSHTDMVCSSEGKFDFEKDSISLKVEGDFVKAEGTTLGGDNGIGVAMTMAILASDSVEHPPLTGLFTVAEEVGLLGAAALEAENITGDILINIDSEEEGVFLASCAGGINCSVNKGITKTGSTMKEAFNIKISHLLGGHSGVEIHKERANALKLMGRLLEKLEDVCDFDIEKITGGEKSNIITSRAEVLIHVDSDDVQDIKDAVSGFSVIVANEYSGADPNITIEAKSAEGGELVYDRKSRDWIIDLLRLVPFGVQSMSTLMPGLVESSINPGVLSENENELSLVSSIRSSVKSRKEEIFLRLKRLSDLMEARIEKLSDYPEWQFREDSPVRDLMLKVWEDMYESPGKVDAIHGGLECGILKGKLGDIDMISMGPNLYDVHSPKEKMSVSSVRKTYDFLVEVLKRLD